MSTAIVPRCTLSIRPATMNDFAFIDGLQHLHNKAVGFFQRTALEAKINAGHVLIAEGSAPLGYCIAQDRYFKRDDVGVVYQLNVVPMKQRSLIGAALIQASFERAAYGCKLFCCWCAQDLDANYFWESLRFIPLAFRAGSAGKGRTHIFWQRRIRAGDTATPYWFPSKTDGGSMREDRLVLPIPPGTHWKDPMPVLLPQAQQNLALPPTRSKAPRPQGPTAPPRPLRAPSRLWFASSKPAVPKEKPQRKPKVKFDKAHLAAARELRDRYLEQFNSGLVLPQGKYDVSRAIDATPAVAPLLLEQAA
jgi:hypothetical protein